MEAHLNLSNDGEGEPAQLREYAPYWLRVLEVILGLLTVVISVVILANLDYQTTQLFLLLSVALLFNAIRMVATGGVRHGLARFQGLGLLGGGVLAVPLALVIIFLPGLSFETLVFLFAILLTIQGIGRVLHSSSRGLPVWLRGSALAIGLLTISLAIGAIMIPNIAAMTLVPLLAVLVMVNGIEMAVWGLRPTDARQVTLLKLILFSAFYGLIIINWIDLFATSAPAYHVWLIMTYMAPFGVLIVFQGLKDWQLALSLGLLVSLMNDLGYYFIGDLLFNFHVSLVPWLGNQLGFRGDLALFTFEGGFFSFPVTSIMMGASIYGRVAVVAAVLYHWWSAPGRLMRKF